MMNMDLGLRILMLAGSLIYLIIILVLLKRGKLNVQYSIIWLASAVVLIIFAVFPYIVAVLRDIFAVETAANFMFIVMFAFVLLLLLSLSTIVTGFATKIRRLTQTQALLERRVRELEDLTQTEQPPMPKQKKAQADAQAGAQSIARTIETDKE